MNRLIACNDPDTERTSVQLIVSVNMFNEKDGWLNQYEYISYKENKLMRFAKRVLGNIESSVTGSSSA